MQFVTPAEVFAAINHARSASDPHGDSAFELDSVVRVAKGTAFRTFKVLKQSGSEWKYIPLNLRFVNVPTKARVIKPDDKFAKPQLTFGSDHEYGAAKKAIYEAFQRIVASKMSTLNASNPKIVSTIQYTQKDGKKLDDPLIRVNFPFVNDRPAIEVFDATKPLPNKKWELLRLPAGDQLHKVSINSAIKPGSECSGIDNMAAVCVSNYGVSLPSRLTILMVRPNPNARFNAHDVFDMDVNDPDPEVDLAAF